jgi:hypothetical protein
MLCYVVTLLHNLLELAILELAILEWTILDLAIPELVNQPKSARKKRVTDFGYPRGPEHVESENIKIGPRSSVYQLFFKT